MTEKVKVTKKEGEEEEEKIRRKKERKKQRGIDVILTMLCKKENSSS